MSWVKKLLIVCLVGFFAGILTIVAMYFYVRNDLPDVATLKEVKLQTPMQVYTADGQLISQFGEKRRIPLKLDEMPPLLIQAFLAIEDTRFYDHPGIDIIGIMRAATVVASSGDFSQGASTITQQLARNFFLSREKKIIRKIKEVFLAFKIEQLLEKDEILELYLNKIELGHRSFGVGAAAQVYFGKTVDELTLDEIAIIAGLPKAPSILNPIRSPANARSRRDVVLTRMRAIDVISEQDYRKALAAPITSKLHGAQITASAPYIAEMVRQQMVERFGEEVAYSEGYKVYTTVQSEHQQAAKQALQQNLYNYDERHGYRGPVARLWQAELDANANKPDTDAEQQPVFTETDRPEHAEIIAYLAKQQGIEDLMPAIVLSVFNNSAEILLASEQTIMLEWDGLKWARAFINDERQGVAPKSAAAILAPGMHILVRQQDDQWRLSQIPAASSALVAVNPQNGAIQALVGGYSFSQSQFNRVTQAKRQVGSNIKPFIYSAALEQDYTLASIMNDAPIHQWDDNAGIAWRPRNSPPVYDGPIRIREALAKSKNVVSVRLLRGVGIDESIRHLQRFGFTASDLPRNETLSLGSASLTPLELVTGYAVFANGGFLVTPFVVDRVLNEQDEVIYQHTPEIACSACQQQDVATDELAASDDAAMTEADTEQQLYELFNTMQQDAPAEPEQAEPLLAEQVISNQNAFLIADALTSSVWGGGDWSKGTGWNGTAWRVQRLKRRDISAKTGTTNDSKDTWFSGFTTATAVTTWVGFDDANRSLGRAQWHANMGQDQSAGTESGARTALPAWLDYMTQVLPDFEQETRQPPTGLSSVRIDLASGLLSRSTDHTSSFEYFKIGTEPTQYSQSNVQQIYFDNDKKAEPDESELF
ncbi:penicillin-binding protein 1A [Arsukibacterium indicum]|uniref:Penicillin-binding protein 1A n=1 Tax=Arsukibacterium indicum TaxID=2848612 RepID=A0ABS6MML8_9GAMM|nr:PBP1A family penicillin-binding protein [Arsukibacterium indicum]MBV2130047.1 PBP1A family penicillin-binding protein [Arsukibacterium indicum]